MNVSDQIVLKLSPKSLYSNLHTLNIGFKLNDDIKFYDFNTLTIKDAKIQKFLSYFRFSNFSMLFVPPEFTQKV